MNELNYREIGNKIREKRKNLNLTQLDLANAIGLTESSISRYESGRIATMPTSTINKICNVLKIDAPELLGITNQNTFEYDLKDILKLADKLPTTTKNELISLFKQQLQLCVRLYDENN